MQGIAAPFAKVRVKTPPSAMPADRAMRAVVGKNRVFILGRGVPDPVGSFDRFSGAIYRAIFQCFTHLLSPIETDPICIIGGGW